ncbi:MAG TPA: hypothetical protein PLZ93_10850, partial [Nocardioides sp.]|nr:hypothetical protein [Nocardioides sp.]
MSRPAERPFGWAPCIGLLAGVCLSAATAARCAPDGYVVATFWPAAGLGLMLLALAPARRWLALVPLLTVAGILGDLLAERGLRLSVTHGVWEALAALGA